MKRDKLVIIMIALTVIGIMLTSFLFYYTLKNRDAISQSIQQSVESELARYNLEEYKNIEIDESMILLAVARYCDAHNECRGSQGLQGIPGIGIPGATGPMGLNGYTPIKGVDYFDGKDGKDGLDGQDGQPGIDGRNIERRCNPMRNRMEWRYVGDESWTPEFNLSPLQTCAMED